MAWETPKTNWAAEDGLAATDMNRIEGNIQELYDRTTPDVASNLRGASFSCTTTAAALSIPGNPTNLKEIILQAAPDNTANVLIGDSASTCFFALLPSASISLPLSSGNIIWRRAASGSQVLNVMWRY